MFICICNAVTEEDIKKSITEGSHSLPILQAKLGVGSCCGCCKEVASSYLPSSQNIQNIKNTYQD